MIYGYARISTDKQNMERQIRNILAVNAQAKIYQEVFTGTKTTGRRKLEALLKRVQSGDTIIFDSVSRMSRDAEEGYALYKELYDKGIRLVFINEPYIDTDVYENARKTLVPLTGTDIDCILEGINNYLMCIAEQQIKLAFQQAQKERDDLSERTRQGLQTARLNGKQLGRAKGTVVVTKKSDESKKKMLQHAKTFGGTLTDVEMIKLLGIDKNTYYKYKKELKNARLCDKICT